MTTQVPGQEERLARLAARRGGAIAPPTPATSARATTASAPPPPPAPGRSSFAPAAAPANRTARRHAAKGSRRAALALSVTTTVGLTAYFAQVDSSAASSSAAVSTAATVARATTSAAGSASTSTAGSTTATATQATTAVQAGTASTTATAAAGATLADGTFTGTTDTNRWGPVQVQVTITGGKITDVTALQTPSGGRSDRINAQAVPILQSEALTAQSAQIDTVSGATYTSTSYRISLQSALDQAAAATSQAKVAA